MIMKIEIIDSTNDIVTEFDLETNPFKVGEIINIYVSSPHNKGVWDRKYLITKIEHYLRHNICDNKTYTSFCVSIQVGIVS